MVVIVSACVMGVNCKYNGLNNLNDCVKNYLCDKEVVMLCPEVMAGMGCPRLCIEMVDGRLRNSNGDDVHDQLIEASRKAMEIVEKYDVEYCVLQSRSPTCGSKQIYDGTFSGKLIDGSGVFAKMLKDKGYLVYDVKEFEEIIKKNKDYFTRE